MLLIATHSARVVQSTSHLVVTLRGRSTLGPYESFPDVLLRVGRYTPLVFSFSLLVSGFYLNFSFLNEKVAVIIKKSHFNNIIFIT